MKDNENKVAAEGFSLKALQAGDQEEFSRLVDAYSNNIYRLAIKMLNQQQDAEDVLQETFIKAYRGLKSFNGRSKLSTWLFRIATNEALMVIRRKHPELVSVEEPNNGEEGEQEPLQIVDWCCLPESDLMSAESRRFLANILALVEQLESAATEQITPMAHPLDATQRLRSDEVSETDQRELFQGIAPHTEAGLYLVPKVIE